MKKFIFALGAVLYCLVAWAQPHAQQGYTIVYDLWFYTSLYPEIGDQQIETNQALFDEQFYRCLLQVQQRFLQPAQQKMNYCNGIADPKIRANCHNENEAAKIVSWVDTMRTVTQGQAIWSQTFLGQATIIAKRELEALTPGLYEQIVQQMAPSVRQGMVCQ